MTKPKRGPGRPTMLTPQVQRDFMKVIRLSGFKRDACVRVGISEQTLSVWMQKGRDGESPYREFVEALDVAAAQRRESYLKESQKRGAKKHDAREIQWRAAVTDPEVFSIKHHVVVQQQLEGAVARLKERFSDRPLILEEILSAIAGEHRGGGVGADAGSSGALFTEGSSGAEADPLAAIPTTIGVPRPGG